MDKYCPAEFIKSKLYLGITYFRVDVKTAIFRLKDGGHIYIAPYFSLKYYFGEGFLGIVLV